MTNKKINYYRTKKSFLPIRAMIFMTTLSFALTTSITQAQETATVNPTTHSDIIPSGLTAGDKFRLLFIPQKTFSPGTSSYTIAGANTHAQSRAAASTIVALQGFSSKFRALVSSSVTDARDNTGTNTATGTDAAGNSATYNFNISVVSETTPTISINIISTDGYINVSEDESPVTISGTSTNIAQNSTITVAFSGAGIVETLEIEDKSATVAADGTWSTEIIPNEIYDLADGAPVTVTATYSTATATQTFEYHPFSPTLDDDIDDQTATVGTDFSFTIPDETFSGESALTYTSSGEGNGITFATDTWSGAGQSLTAGTVTITVTATDIAGNTATDEFNIVIAAATPTISIDTNPFITTWNTEAGDPGNTTIMLPISGGAYDVDINNDGDFNDTDEANRTGTITIDFTTAGVHTIAVRPNAANTNNQLQINHFQTGTPQKLMRIDKWGGIVWTSMQNAFHSCSNMTIANDAGVPDLTVATSTHGMFTSATNFTGDLSGWDVSNVTDVSVMFAEATSFTSDLSSWNISSATSMRAMFRSASSFTTQDYDALLIGWSNLPSLQSNVTFGAPPTNYCAGEEGRNKLTNAVADGGYNWTISGDTGKSCSDLLLSVDAFLQGPYTSSSMMSDGLREASRIPTISPYGDENTIESERTVLGVEGTDAIVDWVEISLHNRNNIGMVISTTPALLQRDGDVVGLNGTADLVISGAVGNYYVSINHRNHIPVITDAAKSLSTTNTAIDFTNDLTIVTGGSNAMAEVEVKSDNSKVYALFSGDVNGNGQIQVDDYNAAIQDVGRGGYLTSDVDMNGELQVSDINFVLKTLGKGAQF